VEVASQLDRRAENDRATRRVFVLVFFQVLTRVCTLRGDQNGGREFGGHLNGR
jgi:hypothetical protein